jgi:predicted phosphodiesterase
MTDTQQKLIDLLSKPNARFTFKELASRLHLTKKQTNDAINKARDARKDILFGKYDRTYYIQRIPTPYSRVTKLPVPTEGRLGLVSDTHLCSEAQRLDCLIEAYRDFQQQGITTVLHMGDMTDGWRQYKNHATFVHCTGDQNQAKYVIENYPRVPGIQTYVISGNHDNESYENTKCDRLSLVTSGFNDKGQHELAGRKDIVFLGQYSHTLILPQEVTIHLLHPKGASPYARSYRQQKRSEAMERNTRPDVQLSGHYHVMNHCLIQGTHFIAMPGLQDETELTKRIGLERSVGYGLLDYSITKGKIRLKTEFVMLD